ncbi:hypothetical protein [Nocardia jiangxiensis]|uniref:hypothetical protein n=1 Tax=Nocardia jiangxiensis TaxID=282685 RepID=UPI0002F494FF|nr:hypothetical protein [Nocardia jiangxiensis]
MNIDDIEKAIKSLADEYGEAGWGSWYTVGEERSAPFRYVKLVESVGGMDEGSHRHLVFEVEFSDYRVRYYKKSGYYSSYDGTSWDGDLHEVKPVKQNITRYEEV